MRASCCQKIPTDTATAWLGGVTKQLLCSVRARKKKWTGTVPVQLAQRRRPECAPGFCRHGHKEVQPMLKKTDLGSALGCGRGPRRWKHSTATQRVAARELSNSRCERRCDASAHGQGQRTNSRTLPRKTKQQVEQICFLIQSTKVSACPFLRTPHMGQKEAKFKHAALSSEHPWTAALCEQPAGAHALRTPPYTEARYRESLFRNL